LPSGAPVEEVETFVALPFPIRQEFLANLAATAESFVSTTQSFFKGAQELLGLLLY
jgi:hypothetical protein